MDNQIVCTMEVAFGGAPDDKVKLVIRCTANEGEFELLADGGYLESGAPSAFGTFNRMMDLMAVNAKCAFRGH